MFVTRRLRGAKPQVKGAQGSTGHSLSLFGLGLGGYVHMSVHKTILCPRVGGNREEWLARHVDGRPTVHHLQTNSIKSMEGPLYPYIRILTVEYTHHTILVVLHLKRFRFSSRSTDEALSGVENQVESSLELQK
jgi:hypothetical protein